MSSLRYAARRPALRCLNTPPRPCPQLRQAHFERGDIDLNNVSLHRADQIRRAQRIRRRNWLLLGTAVGLTGNAILIKIAYDLKPPEDEDDKDKKDEKEEGKQEKTSRGVLDLINSRPTQTDAPRAASEEFQGKKVVVAAGDKIIAAPKDADHPAPSDVDAIELVETGTSYVPYFPKTISLPTSAGPEAVEAEAEYSLLGLGIRRVSFLNIQVYIVGLYVKNSDLAKLQNHLINTVNSSASALIPGEKEDLRKALLDAEKSTEIWQSILSRQGTEAVDMAFRVVPVRGTDFKHLQDGWMRGITSRTDEVRRKQAELLRQQATESKTIALPKPVDENEFSDDSFGLAMKDFKGLFQGRGKAPKGSVILLSRDQSGVLRCAYQPIIKTNKGEKMGEVTKLGEVRDARVSRLVWELYLAGQNVSSEEARKNIVSGCISIVERPVGTVEGMVQ